jgi:coproporphyrinogen III oxidase-like Fe-S oxidoreductase
MRFSYRELDGIRQHQQILSPINIKDLLRDCKNVGTGQLVSLWKSYLKHSPAPKLSLYIHTPFCLGKRCNYCEYPSSILRNPGELDLYLDSLEKQARLFSEAVAPMQLDSLYLGGGTSTIYSLGQLRRLYTLIFGSFCFHPDAEISLELSLRTIDREKIRLSLERGFRKFTFGVQSFDPEVLRLANREPPDIGNTMLSLDLMWGLPGDTPHKLESSLRKALDLSLDVVILYNFHYFNLIKERNLSNPAYHDYKQPYPEAEVKKLLLRLSAEYPGYEFSIENLFSVRMKLKSKLFLGNRSYVTHPSALLRNSTLGLGIFSRSFIENHFTYLCNDFGSYDLYYYKDLSCQRILFIQDMLFSKERVIDTAEYRKLFSRDLEQDFGRPLSFLLENRKLKKEGSKYFPLIEKEEDIVDIGLAFCPEGKLEEWRNANTFPEDNPDQNSGK